MQIQFREALEQSEADFVCARSTYLASASKPTGSGFAFRVTEPAENLTLLENLRNRSATIGSGNGAFEML